MSIASALKTSQLPEKPWQSGAVGRLFLCIIIGMMMGAVVSEGVRYFETPETSSAAGFLALAAGAFISYVAAIVMLARPWPSDPDIVKLIVLLACIYLGIFFTWAASRLIKGDAELKNPVIAMLIALLAFQGLALLLVHFFLRQHLIGWCEGFGFNIHPGQSLLIGVGAGILVVYPVVELNGLFFQLFDRLTLHPQTQPAVEILSQTVSLLSRAVLGVITVMLVPIAEEAIFRGVLYPWAKRKFSQPIALWGTAIVFGAIHLNLSSFVPLTVLALVLIWLYEYTGNLLAPIAVHFVFNAWNFIELFHQQK